MSNSINSLLFTELKIISAFVKQNDGGNLALKFLPSDKNLQDNLT